MRKVLRKYLERIPLFTVFCGKSTSPLVCNENFLLTKTALFMKTTRGEGGDPLDKYLRWIIIKKDTGDTSVFFVNFANFLRKPFLQKTSSLLFLYLVNFNNEFNRKISMGIMLLQGRIQDSIKHL